MCVCGRCLGKRRMCVWELFREEGMCVWVFRDVEGVCEVYLRRGG